MGIYPQIHGGLAPHGKTAITELLDAAEVKGAWM